MQCVAASMSRKRASSCTVSFKCTCCFHFFVCPFFTNSVCFRRFVVVPLFVLCLSCVHRRRRRGSTVKWQLHTKKRITKARTFAPSAAAAAQVSGEPCSLHPTNVHCKNVGKNIPYLQKQLARLPRRILSHRKAKEKLEFKTQTHMTAKTPTQQENTFKLHSFLPQTAELVLLFLLCA